MKRRRRTILPPLPLPHQIHRFFSLFRGGVEPVTALHVTSSTAAWNHFYSSYVHNLCNSEMISRQPHPALSSSPFTPQNNNGKSYDITAYNLSLHNETRRLPKEKNLSTTTYILLFFVTKYHCNKNAANICLYSSFLVFFLFCYSSYSYSFLYSPFLAKWITPSFKVSAQKCPYTSKSILTF